MFKCIVCTPQTKDDGGDAGGSTTPPSSKEAVKSLTTQIKDMALKFSGAYRQCRPSPGPSSYRKGQRPYPDFDTASEGIPYPFFGSASSGSTPALDFPSSRSQPTARGDDELASANDVVVDDDNEPKEWMAQVEPGVHITFVSLPDGGNDLRRIRFSIRLDDQIFSENPVVGLRHCFSPTPEMFDKWQAQRWWGENYDRIMELYNVKRFNRQALHTPPRSEDELQRDSSYSMIAASARESPMTSSMHKEWMPRTKSGSQNYNSGASSYGAGYHKGEVSSFEASRTTTSSRDEASVSVSNASDLEAEWVEEDEPGVYITIRQLADGTRELRRVRFSREKFGETNAKQWWEENRERIQAQYL